MKPWNADLLTTPTAASIWHPCHNYLEFSNTTILLHFPCYKLTNSSELTNTHSPRPVLQHTFLLTHSLRQTKEIQPHSRKTRNDIRAIREAFPECVTIPSRHENTYNNHRKQDQQKIRLTELLDKVQTPAHLKRLVVGTCELLVHLFGYTSPEVITSGARGVVGVVSHEYVEEVGCRIS